MNYQSVCVWAVKVASFCFLDGQKVTKEPTGGGRNRQKRLRRSCLHAARPLEPPLRGDAYLSREAEFPARKI